MSKGGNLPDVDDFRLPDSLPIQRVGTPTTQRLRAKKQSRFALGPIPLGWWKACHQADSNGLSLALGLLMESCSRIDRPAERWVTVSETFGQQLGLSRNQRHRAVAGLEEADLIQVERKRNHAPLARLLPWQETKNGK